MRRWLALALAGLLGGCPGSSSSNASILGQNGNAAGALAGNPGGGLANNSGGGLVNNSGGSLANNAGGALIGNTGAAFNGSVSGPAGLMGNTGAALIGNTGAALAPVVAPFRTLGLAQAGIAGAIIYLTSPDERIYALGGRPVTTTTNSLGQYDFGRPVVPEGEYVIVNAMLAGNRRLVGFTVSRNGQNQVDVDVATTYVLEFLRAEARRSRKTFKDYDLAQLPGLVALTEAMLDDGRLGLIPDNLIAGESRTLVDDYVAAMGQRGPDLLLAWKVMLGAAPVAMVRFAGTGKFGLNGSTPASAREAPANAPLAIAANGDKTYLALTFLHQVMAVSADGLLGPVTALAQVDPALEEAPAIPGHGTPVSTVRIPEPRALAQDGAGNLFLTLNSPFDRPANVVLMICVDSAPKFGLTGLEAGRIYRVAGTPAEKLDDTGFRGPSGLAVDSDGNLFVADQKNDRIMRVDRQTGILTRVAGTSPLSPQYPVLVDGDQDARQYGLFRPTALAWRKAGADEELFVVDSYFERIRSVRAPGSDWGSARMRTIAGAGKAQLAGGPSLVPGSSGGDGLLAQDAGFHFARVDVADWQASEISDNGLALDTVRNRLYVADRHNQRVRVIDLATGLIDTLAGGGRSTTDGQATNVELDQPTGLALTADGDLLVTDFRRDVVWRILLSD